MLLRNTAQYHEYMLPPGYVATSAAPSRLCSVCGSGVVLAIWDRVRRCGGMAHCTCVDAERPYEPSNYAAATAIPVLMQELACAPHTAHRFEAHVLGGGVRQVGDRRDRKNVTAIVACMKKILRHFGVKLLSEDTGGTQGRKVMFDTHSGELLVLKTHRIRSSDWALAVTER